MSGNSWLNALQTAPIVTAFCGGWAATGSGVSGSSRSGSRVSDTVIARPPSAAQERQLVLADLELVAIGQPVRLDAAAVDVGAVQRAAVVEVVVAAAAHQDRVIARDGDVVEKDVAVGPPTHGQPISRQRKRLARAPAPGPDDEGRSARDDVLEA